MDLPSSPLPVDFSGLGGSVTMTPAMRLALEASFGTVERWQAQLLAMGKARGSAAGRLLLVFDVRDGTLASRWAADHGHAAAGGTPLLALDLFEYAYQLDFDHAGAAYVEAFTSTIDWAPVYERYQAAVDGASESFGAEQDQLAGALLLDVRRAGVFEKAATLIPGARWRDPAAVAQWAPAISVASDVVVYCVYGHEVGRVTALRLRSRGLSARYLRGGIDAWQTAKRPLAFKGEAT